MRSLRLHPLCQPSRRTLRVQIQLNNSVVRMLVAPIQRKRTITEHITVVATMVNSLIQHQTQTREASGKMALMIGKSVKMSSMRIEGLMALLHTLFLGEVLPLGLQTVVAGLLV